MSSKDGWSPTMRERILVSQLQVATEFANKAHRDLQEALRKVALMDTRIVVLEAALAESEEELSFLRRHLPPDDAVAAMAERDQEQIRRRERRTRQ